MVVTSNANGSSTLTVSITSTASWQCAAKSSSRLFTSSACRWLTTETHTTLFCTFIRARV